MPCHLRTSPLCHVACFSIQRRYGVGIRSFLLWLQVRKSDERYSDLTRELTAAREANELLNEHKFSSVRCVVAGYAVFSQCWRSIVIISFIIIAASPTLVSVGEDRRSSRRTCRGQ